MKNKIVEEMKILKILKSYKSWFRQCMIKAHNGEIKVESKSEEGSTFTITLPIQ